jgi:Ca2+-binding EF-hand superfamily protein
MKLPSHILFATIAAAVAAPTASLAAKAEKKSKNATPTEMFDAMDKDGNGVVTQAEYIASVKERLGEDGAKTRLAEMDKNKDGKLSKEEFGVRSDQPKQKKRRKKKDE